jgi:hypothetical protein
MLRRGPLRNTGRSREKGLYKGAERRAQSSGLRAQGAGHRAQGTGRRAQGKGHRAQGAGRRAQGKWQRGLTDHSVEFADLGLPLCFVGCFENQRHIVEAAVINYLVENTQSEVTHSHALMAVDPCSEILL